MSFREAELEWGRQQPEYADDTVEKLLRRLIQKKHH